MLFRRKDFHGGRAYDSDRSDRAGLRSRASLVIGRIKQRLKGQTPPSTPYGFVPRKALSNRGSDARHVRARELDTKVFPMADRLRDTASTSEVG